jgi:hypothetical protein
MPDWLIQVIVQYPIVAIIGLVAWYAHREMKRQADQCLERENVIRAEGEARRENDRKELLKSKDAHVKYIDGLLRGEIKRLSESVDELNKRLGG